MHRLVSSLRPDHPDILASAHNLATDLYALGDYRRARDLDEDTLRRRRRLFGDNHRDTQASADNLAIDIAALANSDSAESISAPQSRHATKPGNDLSAFR